MFVRFLYVVFVCSFSFYFFLHFLMIFKVRFLFFQI